MKNQVAVMDQRPNEDIELIKSTVCKGASDSELKLFLNFAKRTGLDPLAKQIFAVKRWDSKERREIMQPQVSIDGLRVIAERTGVYRGQVGPEWCGEDGVWKDIWLSEKPPMGARVGVWKEGFKEPLWGKATYKEFCAKTKEGRPNHMWQQFPETMLAKCAESVALRRAFPNDMSGLYTPEEMGQANNDRVETKAITERLETAAQAPVVPNPPVTVPVPTPVPVTKPAAQDLREQFNVKKQQQKASDFAGPMSGIPDFDAKPKSLTDRLNINNIAKSIPKEAPKAKPPEVIPEPVLTEEARIAEILDAEIVNEGVLGERVINFGSMVNVKLKDRSKEEWDQWHSVILEKYNLLSIAMKQKADEVISLLNMYLGK